MIFCPIALTLMDGIAIRYVQPCLASLEPEVCRFLTKKENISTNSEMN